MTDKKEDCCENNCNCDKESPKKLDNSIYLEKIIEVDKISNNSVILFKVNDKSESVLNSIKYIMDFYGDKLEKKNCLILVTKNGSDISLIPEEEMNKLGWFKKDKKEKSLIIH